MASATSLVKLEKIETFFKDAAYKELIESSETYNTRLCIERRLRMPFLDPQTGTAQDHSALYKSKRQRLPGLREGQLYSYPAARWRKSRRQYLQRSYYRPRESEMFEADYSNHGGMSGLGSEHLPSNTPLGSSVLMEMDSKDSHSGVHAKDEMSNNPWYYDELDAMEMDEFEDVGPDSDFDFEESYSKKKGPKKGRGEGSTRKSKGVPSERTGSDTPTKKSTTSRRGRKAKLNLDGDRSSSPMAYSSKKSRHSMQLHDDHSNSSFVANLDIPATPHMPPHQPSAQHQMIAPRPELFGAMADQQTPLIPVSVSNAAAVSAGTSSAPLGDVGGPPAPAATVARPTGNAKSGCHDTCSPTEGGRDHSRRGEKGKLAAPSPYCDFCLGDTRENKKTGTAEELVSCSDCGRSGHPSCLQFTANMMVSVKRYRWQCIECKYCSICGTSDNDDQLLFCDDCDRGYHMYCLSPALTSPPEGSWSCKLCVLEFHTPKPKGAPASGSLAPGTLPPPGAAAGGPIGPPQGPPMHHIPPGGGPAGMPLSAIAQQQSMGGPPPPNMHGYPPGMAPQMMGPHPSHPGGHPGPPPPPHAGPPLAGPMMHHPGGPPPPGQPPTTHANPMPGNHP